MVVEVVAMVGSVVVWSESQQVSRLDGWREALSALVFHYQRMVLGANYGMKGAAA